MSVDFGNKERLRVLVAGAGTMGHGLALVMARAGHEVCLLDVDEKILDRALSLIESHLNLLAEAGKDEGVPVSDLLKNIHPSTDRRALSDADLVLESIVEDPEAKRAFYSEAARLCRPDAVVSSNTSYLDVFELAPPSVQERLLITHFYAPPYLIPLVEIVKGPETDRRLVEGMRGFLRRAGQKPIVLEKFIPGFIVNRLQRAMAREIFHLLDGGYASAEEIDRAVLASLGVRLPVLGVVKRYDFAGIDFALKVFHNPSIHLVNEDRPPKCLEELVSQKRLGVKSGRGFYDYEGMEMDEILHKRDRLLIRTRELIDEIEAAFWEGETPKK